MKKNTLKTVKTIIKIATAILIIAVVILMTQYYEEQGKSFGDALLIALVGVSFLTGAVAVPYFLRVTGRSFQKKERRSSEERMESYRLNAEARAEARYMSHCDDSEYRYLQHRADERAYRSQLDAEKKHEMELEKLLRANKEGETFEETLARLEARRKEAEAALRGYKKSHSDDEVDRTLDADDSRYK